MKLLKNKKSKTNRCIDIIPFPYVSDYCLSDYYLNERIDSMLRDRHKDTSNCGGNREFLLRQLNQELCYTVSSVMVIPKNEEANFVALIWETSRGDSSQANCLDIFEPETRELLRKLIHSVMVSSIDGESKLVALIWEVPEVVWHEIEYRGMFEDSFDYN